MDPANTLPKCLKGNYEKWGNKRIALRDKKSGIWQEYSWRDYYQNVKKLALGLKGLGFQAGDKICILGDNEPEWYWAELACHALGGAAVGIFVDSTAEEVKEIINHSDAVFLLARDQEQTDKILQIRKEIPKIKKTIHWVSTGMENYHDPFILNFRQVQQWGEEYENKNPGSFEAEIEKGTEEDLAILNYTSGATGSPKGCMLSHKNLIHPIRHMAGMEGWNENDNYFSFFPAAWVLEQYFGLTTGLVCGAAVHFPEGPETLQNDLREIGPSIVVYNFRMWENLYFNILSRIKGGSFIKRTLFNACLSLGSKAANRGHEKGESKGLEKIFLGLANLLVFRPLKDKIGFLRTRSAFAGGAPMSPGVFRFFQAIGVPLRQIYASSETGISCCPPRAKNLACNLVGLPLPWVEVKISEKGELFIRGDQLCAGYYKDTEATAKVMADGWCATGDAFCTDEKGHLLYLDRLEDLLEVDGKTKFPSATIESTLRFSPFIKEGIVPVSGRPPYVVTLIQIDFQAVGKWAESQRIAYTHFADLSQKSQVHDLLQEEIRVLNLSLPEAVRVKKFVCLPKELSPDEGELTRDGKPRKYCLREKYADLLEAIYAGKESFLLRLETKSGTHSSLSEVSISIKTLS